MAAIRDSNKCGHMRVQFMKARPTILTRKQSTAVEKSSIEQKAAGVEEQQERKQWAKKQRIMHQYCEEDSDDSKVKGGGETDNHCRTATRG